MIPLKCGNVPLAVELAAGAQAFAHDPLPFRVLSQKNKLRERISIELMTSDRKLQASREGLE